MSLGKYLMIPQLMVRGRHAEKNLRSAWNRYWGGIRRTGTNGEVLWDGANQTELQSVVSLALEHMDTSLPLVDAGCGNGRFTRALAPHFPKVLGVDWAAEAVKWATKESESYANASFRAMDMSETGAGRVLAAELGDVNLFTRGVLHIISHEARLKMIANMRDLLGKRGTLYLLETNERGDPLDLMKRLGTKIFTMPPVLSKTIEAGCRIPEAFGEAELRKYFPEQDWQTVISDAVVSYGVPVGGPEPVLLNCYFAILRPRR